MKKFLSIVVILGIIFTLAGCGIKTENDSNVDESKYKLQEAIDDAKENGWENVDIDELADAMGDYAEAAEGKIVGFANASEYVEYCKNLPEYKEMIESSKDSGMEIEFEAEENDLVYRYKYTFVVANNAATALKQSFESNKDSIKIMADAVRVEAPCVKNIRYEYYSKDGELICSFEI